MPTYALSDDALLAQCEIDRSSVHSPGGQHRNKAEASVRLRHRPSGLTAQCEAHRDRADNRREALRRLRLRLAIAERGAADPAWIAGYRHDGRLLIDADHDAWHLVVACALDALDAHAGAVAPAAAALAIGSSQFARALAADKESLQAANRIRMRAGLGALRG